MPPRERASGPPHYWGTPELAISDRSSPKAKRLGSVDLEKHEVYLWICEHGHYFGSSQTETHPPERFRPLTESEYRGGLHLRSPCSMCTATRAQEQPRRYCFRVTAVEPADPRVVTKREANEFTKRYSAGYQNQPFTE